MAAPAMPQNKPRAGMDSISPVRLFRPADAQAAGLCRNQRRKNGCAASTDTNNIDNLLIMLIVGMDKMYNLLSGAVFTKAGRG